MIKNSMTFPRNITGTSIHMKKILIAVLALLLTATLFVTNATAQEKITGPWLWMIAPTEPWSGGAASIDIDSLAVASGGAVTEADIAANGARAGDFVGNYAWTFGEISATGGDNINECLNRIGMTNGNVDDHSSYALFQFQADTALHGVTMHVGSDDAIKVWLNGAVVHNHPVNRGAGDFQDTFPVNVVAGENLLLVKVSERGGGWSMFVGMDTAAAPIRVSIVDPPIQEPVQPQVVETPVQELLRVPWLVSLIYFRPSDRPVRPNVDAEIDGLIKKTQRFFADQLEVHGFGRKTFQFEADANGNAVVHHVNGKFPSAHYQQNRYSWVHEIREQIDIPDRSITVHMLDSDLDESLTGALGTGSGGNSGGSVDIDAWDWGVLAHELAHAFELQHDYRNNANAERIQTFSEDWMVTSFCAAEWLSVHPAFNPGQPVSTSSAKIVMLSPTLASPPNTIRLRFEVTDIDGLHQAQLRIPDFVFNFGQYVHMVNCKRLNGRHSTVEFVTTALQPQIGSVTLHVIDMRGHMSKDSFSIDVVSLLPPAKVVSIPDPNLAAAVSAGEPVTTHSILNLVKLEARNRGIKSLTGLEHAVNLRTVDLGGEGFVNSNAIPDVSPFEKLTNLLYLTLGEMSGLRDVSALASLTNLRSLDLGGTGVSDISALASLTNLAWLRLDGTGVSDILPLASLTNLRSLDLEGTAVSDVSVLAHLTNLEWLDLGDTGVSDISALASLTNLRSLDLGGTGVSDISALASLTNLAWLRLDGTAVSDVSVLAHLTNLKTLSLWDTGVSDISALASLTNLRSLGLNYTDVSDVSVLAHLTNLETLFLGHTAVSDVSVLTHLTNLKTLGLSYTAVSDVSVLAHLTNLEDLFLFGAAVSDVSVLAHLTNLERLYLSHTDVSDVSPLLGLSLPGRDWESIGLRLRDCPLSYASIHTHIPALQAKGIEVEFDNVAHPALLKVSGDRQEVAGATTLSNPFVVEAMDEHGKPIVGRTVQFDILGGGGSLSARTVETDASGKARVTLTLGSSQGENKVKASAEGIRSWVLFTAVGTGAASQLVADVNGDGVTDLTDLAIVAQAMGKPVENPRADVNGDGVVDGEDFALVAAHLGEGEAAAPSQAALPAGLTLEKVEWALNLLYAENTGSPAFRRGIAKLEGLLALLVPDKTLLLANYPNPFNPETWIPYQLANPAAVTVSIHASDGKLVRTLTLGQMPAGVYQIRSRAAYWDGRNAQGEPVASGVYFYTLTAGDFKATRKMVIRK